MFYQKAAVGKILALPEAKYLYIKKIGRLKIFIIYVFYNI